MVARVYSETLCVRALRSGVPGEDLSKGGCNFRSVTLVVSGVSELERGAQRWRPVSNYAKRLS